MLSSGVFGYLRDYLRWWFILLLLLILTSCFFKFFPWRERRKLGLVLGNTMIFLSMLGIFAMVGESYFRFVCVEIDAFGVSLPARRWFALHTKLNSLGYRDDEWSIDKSVGVRRIAFVGDSFTYGWGIERVKDRFTDGIQARINRVLPGSTEVMNVAKPGWDTSAQIKPIQDMIALFGVDEVILCYVPNDIEKLLPTKADFNPTKPPHPALFNPDSSALFDSLYHRICVPRAPTVTGYHDWLAAGFATDHIWRRHQQQLRAIVDRCQEQGVTLRVVLLPFIRTNGDKFQPKRLYTHLQQFFEASGVRVLNLYPVIAGVELNELMVSKYDAHPNERANELFAEAIWQAFYAKSFP